VHTDYCTNAKHPTYHRCPASCGTRLDPASRMFDSAHECSPTILTTPNRPPCPASCGTRLVACLILHTSASLSALYDTNNAQQTIVPCIVWHPATYLSTPTRSAVAVQQRWLAWVALQPGRASQDEHLVGMRVSSHCKRERHSAPSAWPLHMALERQTTRFRYQVHAYAQGLALPPLAWPC
jgi:hypothetical protein